MEVCLILSSWIGSVQLCLVLSAGLFTGRAFDAGYLSVFLTVHTICWGLPASAQLPPDDWGFHPFGLRGLYDLDHPARALLPGPQYIPLRSLYLPEAIF